MEEDTIHLDGARRMTNVSRYDEIAHCVTSMAGSVAWTVEEGE